MYKRGSDRGDESYHIQYCSLYKYGTKKYPGTVLLVYPSYTLALALYKEYSSETESHNVLSVTPSGFFGYSVA